MEEVLFTKGFTMWLLLMVLLTPPVDINHVTVLDTFETYEDCQPERNRIGFEMAESYPYENDFRIVCEFREETPSIMPVRHELNAMNSFTPVPNHPLAQ